MKHYSLLAAVAVVAALGLNSGSQSHNLEPSVAPVVVEASIPIYPRVAHMANIHGTVHLQITSDGHRVTAIRAENGPKLLVSAAETNVRTWQFDGGKPTTFIVTYKYSVIAPKEWTGDRHNSIITLRLPSEVDISILRWPPVGDLSPDNVRE